MPLSLKYSPIEQPVYGARNWSGAASLAVAATTVVYSIAPASSKVFTVWAIEDLFCPIPTYIQYSFFDSSSDSFIVFWFIMVSIAIAVFPVCLSPIINSLWPLPTGIRLSIAFKPVCIGSDTDFLGIIPGAFTSILLLFSESMLPFPSIGFPNASTTLPSSSLPTGTSTIALVRLTVSPSLIFASLPNKTTPTLSSSRFKAIPLVPSSKRTISPAWTLSNPYILAIPSPIDNTCPTSLISESEPKFLISSFKIFDISEGCISI